MINVGIDGGDDFRFDDDELAGEVFESVVEEWRECLRDYLCPTHKEPVSVTLDAQTGEVGFSACCDAAGAEAMNLCGIDPDE